MPKRKFISGRSQGSGSGLDVNESDILEGAIGDDEPNLTSEVHEGESERV